MQIDKRNLSFFSEVLIDIEMVIKKLVKSLIKALDNYSLTFQLNIIVHIKYSINQFIE